MAAARSAACFRWFASMYLLSVRFRLAPGVQFPNRLALQGEFHMLIPFVRIPEGMAQKRHTDLTGNGEFEQSGVEGTSTKR